MRQKIYELKRLVNEMESYMYNNNKTKIIELANDINDLSSKIMNMTYENSDDKINKEDKNKEGLEFITSISFLYKPVTKKNYYEGDYLQNFSIQRTDELKRAEILDIHNKFWSVNEIEKGNIFGSLPLELIKSHSKKLLVSYGWEDVEVNVYKPNTDIQMRELFKISDMEFDNYLVVREKKNNEYFILEYII